MSKDKKQKKDKIDSSVTSAPPTSSPPSASDPDAKLAQNEPLTIPPRQSTQSTKGTPVRTSIKRKRGRPRHNEYGLSQLLETNRKRFAKEDDNAVRALILAKKAKKLSKNQQESHENQSFNVEKFTQVLRSRGFTPILFAVQIGVTADKVYRWISYKAEPTVTEYFRIAIMLRLKYYHSLINMWHIRNGIKENSGRDFEFPRNPSSIDFTKLSATAGSPVFVPNRQTRSLLFNRFPIVAGVDFASFVVSDPHMTEMSEDGYNCTFECHLDRLYRHAISSLHPERFSKPEKIAREDLIRNSRRQDPYGKDIWKFLNTAEIYPWTWWDIVGGVKILNDELAEGNESVTNWHTRLAVDDGDGWRKEYYGLYELGEGELGEHDTIRLPEQSADRSIAELEAMTEQDLMEPLPDDSEFEDEDKEDAEDLAAGFFDDDDDEDIDLDIDTAEERKF